MWIEEKYINLVGSRLRNFKRVDTNKYQCSCPLCGDSKKYANKARGSFYIWKGEWWFHCYNCGKAYTIPVFMAFNYPDLHKSYLMETLSGHKPELINQTVNQPKVRKYVKKTIEISDAVNVADLPSNHMAAKYVARRMLPAKYHSELLFVPGFKEWTNLLIPGKFEDIKNDEPRLIIPFKTPSGDVFAYQGRSFDPKSYAKYITIKLDPEAPKIYGMNHINPELPVMVVEGPIDSMFVFNGVADAGGDLKRASVVYNQTVSIWDNEPRNEQIVSNMEKAIHEGRLVCIWPDGVVKNDINDMVIGRVKDEGLTLDEAILAVNQIIWAGTTSGLDAEIKFAQWRKV